jgi:hypothetical protein
MRGPFFAGAEAMDSRRTKRARDAEEALSLEDLIAARRQVLIDKRNEAPALRRRAAALRTRAEGLQARYQIRMRLDLLRRADAIDAEAAARESMEREHTFERTVVTYLRMYSQRVDSSAGNSVQAFVRQTDNTRSRRASIVDEFLAQTKHAPPKVAMAVRDDCVHCAGTRLLLCASRSIMCCPSCGYSVAYLDSTSTSTAFDDAVEYSQYSYKRVNHFSMWLAIIQGKESHRVADDVLTTVMQDLYEKQGIVHPTDITQQRVRETLRRLRLRKAYDHVAQITARLSGVRAKRIPPETEEQLKNMFLKMQPAFQRHAPRLRTNFLSYSYVLYRCLQILGLHHMLDGIVLLKGKEKLEANDAIFRRMCEDLGWPVFDLP